MFLNPVDKWFSGPRQGWQVTKRTDAHRTVTFQQRFGRLEDDPKVRRARVWKHPTRASRYLLRASLYEPGINQFENHIRQPLLRRKPYVLQINVGLTCNMACTHCHVESSPSRTETMSFEVADRILELLKNSRNIHTVDITGGAPEMHQAFRYLIRRIRAEIPHVQRIIDRCNLTVLGLLSQLDLLGFLRDHEVDVIASLPCYMEENVDQQRGNTAFRRSISGLRELNSVGYGLPRSPLRLDLVYNPLGPYLPPDQLELEVQYHDYLYHNFGIFFHRLICITNMPIKRFLSDLVKAGQYEAYMNLLVNAYNPATLEGLMCRDQVHVSYDGQLYDCDFNYALEMPMMENRDGDRDLQTVFKLKRSFDELTCTLIRTGPHCFGCTAGCGSSCTGAIMKGT